MDSPEGDVFHIVPIGIEQALWIAVVASLVLWVEEARKLGFRMRLGRCARGSAG